jgi:drug/metabolite transporter (DMT)-like permease
MALPATPVPFAIASMQRRAMGSVLIAIAILTLMDAGIKLMTGTFGTPQILMIRYSAGFLVAALVFTGLLFFGRLGLPTWRSIVRGFQRSMIVTIVAFCFFYALAVIPLAEATAIAFTAPLYLALLGWLILKEPVDGKTWIAILIGLAGVGVISSSAFTNGFSGALSGYLAAAVASFAYATALVLTRLHSASDPVPTMIMLQSGFSALLALPLVALTIAGFAFDDRPFVALNAGWLWLALGIGFLGTIGHLFMTYGFKHALAAKLGPMEYTSLLWAAFYGFIFFQEVPGVRLLIGSALIVVGTWIVMRKEKDTGSEADAA